MKIISFFLLFGCFNAYANSDENNIIEKSSGISRSVTYQEPVIQATPFIERPIGVLLEADFIRDSFVIGVEIFVEKLVGSYVGKAGALRKEIDTLKTEINKIEVALPSFSGVTKCLRDINATYLKSQYLSDKLEQLMSWIESTPVNFTLDEKTWNQEIKNLSERLKFLSSDPFFEIDADQITFFGGIVGTEDVNKLLINFLIKKERGDFKIKEMNIFAFKKIFFDQDIYFPGINLQILSPNIQVVGERVIDLEPLSVRNHKKSPTPGPACGNEDKDSAQLKTFKKFNESENKFKKSIEVMEYSKGSISVRYSPSPILLTLEKLPRTIYPGLSFLGTQSSMFNRFRIQYKKEETKNRGGVSSELREFMESKRASNLKKLEHMSICSDLERRFKARTASKL